MFENLEEFTSPISAKGERRRTKRSISSGSMDTQPNSVPEPVTAKFSRSDKMHRQLIAAVLRCLRSEPGFTAAVAEFIKLSVRERTSLAPFVRFCIDRTRSERAMFVLWQHPESTDEQVAQILGVRRETLSDWEEFKQFKDRFREERPRQTKWRGRVRQPIVEWKDDVE